MEPISIHPEIEHRSAVTAALAELHTRLLDTIAGFDKAIEKAEPGFEGIARDFRSLHISHSAAISEMLAHDGHDPAQDGSIFGAVNRSLVEIRSWFDRIDTNIMDALINGEKHVLEAFDSAIEKAQGTERGAALAAMRDAQIALLDRHAT